MASHFFWKPAKLHLQKSLNGLERSLLYQLLLSNQELTKKAFPEIWEQRMSIKDGRMELPHSLSPDEIHDGFMALLRDEAVQQSYRFCFFIDALDEHEDIPQYDHKYMVDELRKWTQISPSSIKLCVSSREENVFENAFAKDRRIRLQDLTRHDMECFVRSRLESVQDHNTRERLTSEIVKKSDGIFLWVVLVIKQLRQALEDGDAVSVFERELAILPTELKKLFNHLLGSISPFRMERARRIFSMVLIHETLPIKLSLLSCLHLDANEMNARSSMEEPDILPVLDYQNGQDPHKWYKAHEKQARRQLQGYCRGLVEDRVNPEVCKQKGDAERLRPEPDPSKPAGSRCILFVHRTVIEFLEESRILEPVTHQLGAFDAIEAISQSHLAEFQRIPSSLIDPLYWPYLYGRIIELRFHSGKDRSQFDFLVQLEHLISRKFPGWLENELPPAEQCVSKAYDHCVLCDEETDPKVSKGSTRPIRPKAPASILAWLGNTSYILWRVTRLGEPSLSDQTRGIVLHCLMRRLDMTEKAEELEGIVACFKKLLNERASPVTRFLWGNFIQLCSTSLRHKNPLWSRTIGQLIVLFLEKYEKNVVHRTEIRFGGRGEAGGWEYTIMNVKVQGKTVVSMSFMQFEPGTTCYTLDSQFGGNASMEQLVKLWHLENEREILGLLEQEREAMERKEQAANLVVTAQEASEESSSNGTPASDTVSRRLQRIDSAAEIRDEGGVTASCLPVETKAEVDPPQPKAAKTRSIHALGIATTIALLGEKISLRSRWAFADVDSSIAVSFPHRAPRLLGSMGFWYDKLNRSGAYIDVGGSHRDCLFQMAALM